MEEVKRLKKVYLKNETKGLVILFLGCLSITTFFFFWPVHFDTDVTRWLFELQRFVEGDIPYKDFTWQYPPLGIYAIGYWSIVFGYGIQSVWFFLIAISSIIAFLLYRITSFFGFNPVNSAIIVVGAVLSSSLSQHFQLFSLQFYTPSIAIAAVGGLLFLVGILRNIDSDSNIYFNNLIISLGVGISVGTKPEWGVASFALFILYYLIKFLKEKKYRFKIIKTFGFSSLVLLLLTFAIYFPPIYEAGIAEVYNGITGYGFTGIKFSGLSFKIFIYDLLIFCSLIGLILSLIFLKSDRRYVGLFTLYVSFLGLVFLLTVTLLQGISITFFISGLVYSLRYSILLPFLAIAYLFVYKKVHWSNGLVLKLFFLFLFVLILNLRGLIWVRHFSLFIPLNIILLFSTIQVLVKGFFPLLKFPQKAYQLLYLGVCVLMATTSLFTFFQVDSAWLKTKNGGFYGEANEVSNVEDVINYITPKLSSNETILTAPYGGNFEYILDKSHPIFLTQFVKLNIGKEHSEEVIKQISKIAPKFIISRSSKPQQISLERSRFENPEIWEYLLKEYSLTKYSEENKNIGYKIFVKK